MSSPAPAGAPKAPAGPAGAKKTKAASGAKSPGPAGKAPAAGGPKKAAGPGGKSPAKTVGGAKSPGPKGPSKSPSAAAGAKSPGPATGKGPGAKSPTPTGGAKAPGAKSPAKAGAKSPGPSAAGKSPTPTAGAKSPGPKSASKTPASAGAKSPTPAGTKAATPAGSKGPTPQPGGKSPNRTPGGKSPNATPGGKSPGPGSAAPSKAPSAAGSKAPSGAGSKQPSAAATPAPGASKAPSEHGDVQPSPTATPAPTAATANTNAVNPSDVGSAAPSSMPGAPPASSAPGASMGSDPHGQPHNQSQPNLQHEASEVMPDYSPIPRMQSTMMAPSQAGSQPRFQRRPQPQAPKRPTGPLTMDPRSGLPLIEIPRDRQHAFAHLGNDIVLHTFMDVDRISSRGKPLRRVLFVTDQTLFVCEESGGVLRCVQVSKIMRVNVAQDNSNAIALVIPSEYDIILRLDRRQQRDDLLVTLRAVHRRMVDEELDVQMVKEIRTNAYQMDKPAGFQLQRIPQRSRAHLSKALEAIEQQELERQEAIESVQSQLELEHRSELQKKQQESGAVKSKLDEVSSRLRQQQEEMERLRIAYSKCKKRVEEIDGQMGPNGELPSNKDEKIRELNEVVEALTASVAKANAERQRIEAIKRQGDFEERDYDDLEADAPRIRGRSLHQQGLVEVLQRQLTEKERELAQLQSKQLDIQKLNLELKKKEEGLRELEQLVQLPSETADPTLLYSNIPGSSVGELLDGPSQYSPPRTLGATSAHMDPTIGIDKTGTVLSTDVAHDEDGEVMHTGSLPTQKVQLGSGLPEYRIPPDEREFHLDPRTGLKFMEVPVAFQDSFKELVGSIIHFFALGTKLNKRGREQRRFVVISDQSVYQCNTSGHINRCIWITSIREMIIDKQANVALMVDGKNEYDVAFRFERIDVCDQMAEVLKKVNAFLKRTPPMVVTHMDRVITSELKLEKPPTWEFKLHPIRHKKGLYRALQELSKTTAEERARLHEAADQQTFDIIQRLKEEMRGEINMRREREFAKLRQQVTILDSALREKQLEVRNLRRQMAEHRCSVDHVKIAQQGSEAYETQGMYWIPTDPVVLECDLEVLHIQFHDNFVVTSHANGFLNVWDINSADLFRTLKQGGHTARVQAFYFDGRDLISGGFDSTIRRWNILEGRCVKVIHNAHRGHVTCVKFDALHLITSGSDSLIHVWDVSTLTHEKSLRGHKSAVTAFAFNRNTLASAEWGWVFVWDVDKAIVVKALRDDYGGISTLDMHGMTLVTGGTGGVLTVWNLHTGEGEPLEGHTDDVHWVQLQQHFAVSSSADCTIRMWNVKEMSGLGVFYNSYPHDSKRFHFKANRFVVGENRTVKAWTR